MPQAHSSCQSPLFQDSSINTVAQYAVRVTYSYLHTQVVSNSFNTLALISLVLFSVVLPIPVLCRYNYEPQPLHYLSLPCPQDDQC